MVRSIRRWQSHSSNRDLDTVRASLFCPREAVWTGGRVFSGRWTELGDRSEPTGGLYFHREVGVIGYSNLRGNMSGSIFPVRNGLWGVGVRRYVLPPVLRESFVSCLGRD